MKTAFLPALLLSAGVYGQNVLNIPPTIESGTINLVLDEGVHQFYPRYRTNPFVWLRMFVIY
jgi:hypothetical protein